MELYSFLLSDCMERIREELFSKVSVSLWSYIHSYYTFVLLWYLLSSSVSVSLWSYIHSYNLFLYFLIKLINSFCFRLLMELYSFLFSIPPSVRSHSSWNAGFRLLMELYSFLSYGQKNLLLQYVFCVLSWEFFIFEFFLFISNKSIFNSSFFEYRLTNIFL